MKNFWIVFAVLIVIGFIFNMFSKFSHPYLLYSDTNEVDVSLPNMSLSTPAAHACFYDQCLLNYVHTHGGTVPHDANELFILWHYCNQQCGAQEELGDPNNGYRPVVP